MKSAMWILGFAVWVGIVACERKEKVFEMETPGGKIEVEKDKDSGAVDVKVDGKD